MGSEEARIQKLLEEGKLSSQEAEKLLSALSERARVEDEESKPAKGRKVPITLVIGVLTIASFLLFSFFSNGSGGKNLLLNSGFEKGLENKVTSWTISVAGLAFLGSSEKGGLFLRDRKNVHQGNFSISIRNSQGGLPGLLSWHQRLQSFPVGKKLRLSGYIKASDVADDGVASLAIRGLVGLREEALSATTANLSGTSDWTKVQVEVRVDKGIEELQVLCQLKGVGTIWCDDLELKEVD